ncbi:MAG: MarR family transcriptional regulator [Pseudomonadota bacterium]
MKDQLPEHLDEYICFAVYSAQHAINRAYKPLLAEIGLTYPQYITLMALWSHDHQTVGALCKQLRLDTSTLTPMLKRLQTLGHIRRARSTEDERQVIVSLTESGRDLQRHSPAITRCIVEGTGFAAEDLNALVRTLDQLRGNISGESDLT